MGAEIGGSGWSLMRAELAHYGGITVMIPAALVIAVWLRYSSPPALRWWVVTVTCTYSIVAFGRVAVQGVGRFVSTP